METNELEAEHDYQKAMQRCQRADIALGKAIREIEMAQADRIQALTRWERARKSKAGE